MDQFAPSSSPSPSRAGFPGARVAGGSQQGVASPDTLEYRFHEGARSSLNIVAVLCFVLVFAAPLGVWLLLRAARGRVRISSTGVEVKGLGGTSFLFADVARLGLLEVPIVARGLGGALVRRRVGGDKAIHVVVRTRSGKTHKFIASQYESFPQIVEAISQRSGRRCEWLETGLIGVRWPGDA